MNTAKRFAKSSMIYFTGNILTRLVSIFLLPIYTSLLAPEEMGYYDYTINLLNILIPVVYFEIWSGIMRFMFDRECEIEKYKVIFNGMVIYFCSTVLYSLVFISFGLIKDINLIILIYFYGLVTILNYIYGYIARGFGLNKLYVVSGIVASLVTVLTKILLMVVFGFRLEALYLGVIVGFICQIIVIEHQIKLTKNITLKMFDQRIFRNMLKFALPLSLNSASFWFLNNYNHIAITNQLGLSATGVYTIAGKFSAILTLVSTCFSMAWQELAYARGKDTNRAILYNEAANYYLKFLSAGLLLVIPIISKMFPFLIKASYSEAYTLVPLHLLATCASIFSSFLGNIFGAEKKTGVVMFSTIIAAAVNVFLLNLLIRYLGIQAANIAL